MTNPVAPVTNSVITGPSKTDSERKILEQARQGPRSYREVFQRHGLVRIVTAILIADKDHGARDADLGEHGRVVTRAAGHFEGTIEQAHEPRSQPAVHHRCRRIAGRAEIDADAVGCADPLRRRACLGRNYLHGRVGQAAQVEHEACFTGDLARPMHGGVGEQLPRGKNQILAGLFLLQPDALHVVKKGDRGRDGVAPVGTPDGARMGILADAARIAKPLAAAYAAHDGGGQSPGDQRRALLDVQLEVCPDARRIEEAPPCPDRLRIKAPLFQSRLEALAIVGSWNREAGGIERSERASAAQIGDVEPGGLLRADRHHGQIVIGHESCALHRREHGYAGDDSRRAVEVAALRHAVEVRTHDDARRAAVSSGQRHRQVTDRVDGDFEPCGVGRRPGDVVRRLLAVAVAVAHDAAAAARGTAQGFKQRRSQVEIGLDGAGHGHILAGKIAVVTGASSGIGRAIAISFASEGASVVIADITEQPAEGGDSTLEIITRAGGAAFFQKTDVGRWDDVDALIGATVERHGRLDVMVNNAATYSGTALLETEPAQWEQVMRVNLTGIFNGCKRAVQQMITQEPRQEVRGRLINLGSQQGIVTSPGDLPYGVSKAGAIYITRQIAVDYAKHLIVCNCISPGKIVTGAGGLAKEPARLAYQRQRTPWPRFGRPEDVANAAVFLASDRASLITGSNLVIDGGWLAG